MLSLIVGFALGFWVSRLKSGLFVVLMYGLVVGIMAANVSYRDGAGIWPMLLALTGYGAARLLNGLRGARPAGSGRSDRHNESRSRVAHGDRSQPQPTGAANSSGDNEEVYVAAGLAHATFLRAVGRELDDVEFVASALGAFDGAMQALGRKLSHVDMLAMGSVFALRQINDLERMQDAPPATKGDLIGLAMTSEPLEALRAQSGQLAFTVTQNSPLTGPTTP